MQIIRKSSFATSSWKNGGGVTHEAIRIPKGADAFRWRVSVAEIHEPGPFSDFAGYDRYMVLMRGAGVRLTFDGRESRELRHPGDMARFDGAAATTCALLGGACVDLNLMVSQEIKGTRAWTERLETPRRLEPDRGSLLVFAIGGSLWLDAADGGRETLGEWDLAVLSGADAALTPRRPDPAASPGAAGGGSGSRTESPAPLVFFAAVDDNSAHHS
jgi:environmental stress-induced protein Ves